MLIRQGDLILRRIPGQADTKKSEIVTLAVGEESGHSHVTDGFIARKPVEGLPGLLHVQAPTTLWIGGQSWRHDEIKLTAGVYEFWVQRELSADEDIQNVQD